MSSLWQDCLSQLQDQVSPDEFSTWLRPLQADVQGNVLTLYGSNRFVVGQVQSKYLAKITEIVQFLSQNADLVVKLQEGIKPKAAQPEPVVSEAAPTPAASESTDNAPAYRSGLISKHVFANFVEGKSNQLAYAVAQKVAENPGEQSSNPLFLYGGTGLGKTHLLHAIGNGILANNPQSKVVYIHSERFVQGMVKALHAGGSGIEKFKKFYRSLDVLLIDDIQFFAEKKGTQEEFFHTFNSLFEGGRQIILASDRFPKEIDKIEDRLKSRFGWGLSIPIEPPELETRVAILMKKAEEKNIDLPEEVAFFIGQKLRANVRELEGALNRISATAEFTGKKIDIDFVRESLKDMIAVQDRLVTIENIQKVVAEYYRIKVSDLKSKVRTKSIAHARQLAMALAKELTSRSLPEIGKNFGDRDHTTVLHACKAVAKRCKDDSSVQEDYSNLVRTLSS